MYRIKIKDFFKKFDILLLILAWPLVPMIIAEVFVGVTKETQAYFEIYYIILWFLFTMEFVLKLYSTKDKFSYIKNNWFDLLVVLSPIFRSFKIFQLLRTPILLVSDEVIKMFKTLKLNFVYFFIITIVVILVAGDFVLLFERMSPDANIKKFEDAVWWGFVTFSSVGYGDFYPVTLGGRITAIMLMVFGFALFGILVSTAISFFLKKDSIEEKNMRHAELLEDVKEEEKMNEILSRLKKIESVLSEKENEL